MNKLDPDLQRLLKWAREVSPQPAEAPFGFTSRVLVERRPALIPTLLHSLQRTAWTLTCASLVLIVCCGLVLKIWHSSPPPTEEFSSALSFFASNLPQ
jgi:hypothetical protein